MARIAFDVVRAPAFLDADSGTAALLREIDWSRHPMGTPESWPTSLKTVVRIMLTTQHPMYVFWGPEHRGLYNDAYAVSLGPEKHPAMLGEPGREFWSEIWDVIGPQIDLVMRGAGATWHENQLVPIIRNGALDDVYWTYGYSPIDDADAPNGVGGVLVLCSETTDTVLARQRETESAERQRAMFEQAPGFICVLRGPEHVFEFVNESYRALVGDRDYLGRNVREVVPETADQGFFELLDRVYATGERHVAHGVPISFQAEPGEPPTQHIIDFVYAPMFDEAGRVNGIFVEGQDVTAIGRAELALAASEARYRTMTEALPQLVWTCKANGDCDYLSRQWVEYTGIAPDAQLGLGWLDQVIHPDDRERTYAHWMGAVAGEHPYDIDYRIRRHDGQYCWFKTRGTPQHDDHGAVLHWFGTCTDIGDIVEAREVVNRSREELDALVLERTVMLENAQEALRQSQKLEAMGQLTGGVAHDFNNLLTPILGNLDLLQRRGVGGEREQRMIAGALASAERAKTLVQRLLAFARRQPLQRRAVDIAAIVGEMGELIRSTSGPRVRVELVVSDGLPPALADANQLEMALLNLAVNARDAMPEGGQLTITTDLATVEAHNGDALAPGSYVRLAVADTGIGMDEATLARAIEPFFSTKGVGKGTGLGLSMVHGLASQLGGALKIASRKGLGTSVTLWLPTSADELPQQSRSGPPISNPIQAATALLVDDEELVRAGTADMLADLGYSVIEAASGSEALNLVRDGVEFDLLITDHLMPGITGEELAVAVLHERPSVPVLLVSGYAEISGASPELVRLVKPFRLDELAEALTALTGSRAVEHSDT